MIFEALIYGTLIGIICAFFWELHKFTKILLITLTIVSAMLIIYEMGKGNSSILKINYVTEWYDFASYFLGIMFGNSVGTALANEVRINRKVER